MEKVKYRIAGCVYGQLIGDALGTRYEFQKSNSVKYKISQDIDDTNFLNILGGGPFNLKPGQVTDDGELALGLLNSIINKGGYDKDDVAFRYLKWYNSGPFDIGNTTRNAFQSASSYDSVVRNSQKFNQSSLSNGCLMRASPLGIIGVSVGNSALEQICETDCKLTNPNPVCIDGVYVFCLAIKEAIITGNREKAYNIALQNAKEPLIMNVLNDANFRPEPVNFKSKSVTTDSQFMGLLLIALQNAFYELIHGKSFYSSLVNIVARGGDTDTNGCIAGALLGSYYGKHQIPDSWIKSVKINNPRTIDYEEVDQSKIDQLIARLFKLFGI